MQKKLEELLSIAEEKKLYAQVADARKVVLDTLAKIVKLKAGGDAQAANKLADTRFSAALAVYERQCPSSRRMSANRSMRYGQRHCEGPSDAAAC